jgi:hypothetical protein
MAEQSYTLRIQKTSRGYVVKAHSETVTREQVFDTWTEFSTRFETYLDQGWMAELKDSVEKSSFGVGVLPQNAVATKEVVDSLGFPPDGEPASEQHTSNPTKIGTCPECRGTRTVMERTCTTCDGRGVVWLIP